MMYKASEIAKYVINKCTVEGCPISNLQLQKILYYIQREFLQSGKPAFGDQIEAWQFGPVVPNVYRIYSGNGGAPITIQYNINLPEEDKIIIDRIVQKKRLLNPWNMVRDTHALDKAWAQTYGNGEGNHQIIENELIETNG